MVKNPILCISNTFYRDLTYFKGFTVAFILAVQWLAISLTAALSYALYRGANEVSQFHFA